MPGAYTVDASVFLNAFNPLEMGHGSSQRLLGHFQQEAAVVIAPTLVLPEVSAAISRGRGDPLLARQFASALSRLPHMSWVSIDMAVAQESSDIAAHYRLRGADAVYVAVALRFGSTLITPDQQQRERVTGILPVRNPQEVLEEM